ncbi:MAG: hypothetical protein ACT4ON_16630 [Bacteroidota bacterium]
MKYVLKISLVLFITAQSFAQNNLYSFCGKSGDCTMTWEEFMECKKELVSTDKNASISSFVVTIQEIKKKDFIFSEYPAKGNVFSKASLDMIKELRKKKKIGNKLLIDNVEIVQSGKAAKKASAMVITLN